MAVPLTTPACLRSLSVFMKRAHDAQVNLVCTKLSEHLLHGKEDLRCVLQEGVRGCCVAPRLTNAARVPCCSDIYSIGLKTLISDTPEAMGPLIVSRATPFLLRGVSSDKADDGDIKVKIQCMDVMLELLNRFGAHMDEFKRQIMEVMLRQVRVLVPLVATTQRCSCLAVTI